MTNSVSGLSGALRTVVRVAYRPYVTASWLALCFVFVMFTDSNVRFWTCCPAVCMGFMPSVYKLCKINCDDVLSRIDSQIGNSVSEKHTASIFRAKVLTLVKMLMLVLWNITPWGVTGWYEHLRRKHCLHLQGWQWRHVSARWFYLWAFTASQPKIKTSFIQSVHIRYRIPYKNEDNMFEGPSSGLKMGTCMFHRNVTYFRRVRMASQSRITASSSSPLWGLKSKICKIRLRTA
jgi:hypothetical protein